MLNKIHSLVLVGAGKMGMALARGWVSAGLSGTSLVLVDPQPHESVVEWSRSVGATLQDSVPSEPADVVVIAVKPQIIDDVFPVLRTIVSANTLVTSIAAGISVAQLQAGCGTTSIVRTMPNTPAQVGKGVTGLVRGTGVSDEQFEMARALFGAAGKVVELADESDIDALTALSGSGPAYVFHMVEAMAAAGERLGLPTDTAMVLARQTIIGAAALMDQDPTDAGTLRENVTSPKGVTYEALKVLMGESGLTRLMTEAMQAARDRSIELGQPK